MLGFKNNGSTTNGLQSINATDVNASDFNDGIIDIKNGNINNCVSINGINNNTLQYINYLNFFIRFLKLLRNKYYHGMKEKDRFYQKVD